MACAHRVHEVSFSVEWMSEHKSRFLEARIQCAECKKKGLIAGYPVAAIKVTFGDEQERMNEEISNSVTDHGKLLQ